MFRRILSYFRSNEGNDPHSASFAFRENIRVSKDVRFESFKLELRNSVDGQKQFTAGSGCVISGRFVCENENGKIIVGDNTFIGGGLFISINKIEIGSNVLFSWNCTVIDNDAHSLRAEERTADVRDWKRGLDEGKIGKYKDWSKVNSAPVKIMDDAWIGFNSIILKGVTVGRGAVVGAGSVVTNDVPDHTVVAGNPARVIKKLDV